MRTYKQKQALKQLNKELTFAEDQFSAGLLTLKETSKKFDTIMARFDKKISSKEN